MTRRDLSKYTDIKQQDYEAVAGPDWPSFADFQQHHNIEDFVYSELDLMISEPVNNSTFCVLPFYGWEYPLNQPCCILKENYNIDQVRSDMIAGRRTPDCYRCWRLEDAGIKSDRQIKNETLDFYFNQDLKTLFDRAASGDYKIVNYKIDTSNVCNSTCITCDSRSSSAWAQLERKNNVTPSKTWRVSNNDVDQIIDYKTAQSIGFRGGEPFLSATNFYILEQLLAHKNDTCFISFTTNGSSEITDYQKHLLAQFKNVDFCFSIDGVGPVFEYLRYPLKWKDLENNIAYCRQNNITVSASYTVSNLNILYHSQTIEWFDNNNISYIVNPIYGPSYFRMAALPLQVKEYIIKQGLPKDIVGVMSTHTKQDEQDYQEFLIQIDKQDKWKGIDMQDYLPELARLTRNS